ncbi:MAG: NAD(P)/FAD-dependent oxidoreductase [Ilumatobacter sp.]
MKPAATEVLVVGGGPAGTATAIRLADAGHEVTLLEARTEPSIVPRGNLLVPAAVEELRRLGIAPEETSAHFVLGTRLCASGRSVPVRWPSADQHQAEGATISRSELDRALFSRATDAGVTVRRGARATSAIVERGFVRGAVIELADEQTTEIRCRFLVVADGANSRFGRNLGTHRDRRWPYAVSTSTTVSSDRSNDRWAESHLGPLTADGHPVTGHGWVHPLGDGRLNVGITILSTYRDVLGVNSIDLLDRFVETVADPWRFAPTDRLVDPIRWRTPVGGSISPTMGPTFLVVGDAGGLANPFTSHGVGAALTTARLAADVLDEALTVGNSTTLQRYPARLNEEFGRYHQVGRLSARFLGRPWLLRTALRIGGRSEAVMGGAVRVATGELRDDGASGAERAYRVAGVIARFAPSW